MAASADEATYEKNAHKLALVYAAMGDSEKAQETYKALVEKYPNLLAKYSKNISK